MSITLFAHPAARLVKSVPPVSVPPRVNGLVPRDFTGLGTISTTGHASTLGTVLQDHSGAIQLCAVPDPTAIGVSTLVIVVDQQATVAPGQVFYGAERRAVLPFRRFRHSDQEASGDVLPRLAFGGPRHTYDGLGVGPHGQDGGSFWFFEDESEEGAQDRIRWNAMGKSARAIWTVWLFGVPSPVVLRLRDILSDHPKPVAQLPPVIRDGASYPWRDTYVQRMPSGFELPPSQSVIDAAIAAEQEEVAAQAAPSASTLTSTAGTVVGTKRSPPPPAPPKPSNLRSTSIDSDVSAPTPVIEVANVETPVSATTPIIEVASVGTPTSVDSTASRPSPLRFLSEEKEITSLGDERVDHNDELKEKKDEINATVGQIPTLSSIGATVEQTPILSSIEPAKEVHVFASVPPPDKKQQENPSSDDAAMPTPPAEEPAAMPTLRNLARSQRGLAEYRNSLVAVDNETGEILGVLAEGVQLGGSTRQLPPTPLSDEDEVKTPLDGAPLDVTPRKPSVIRAANVYHDPDANRPHSRAPSMLGEDTFAPPPVPLKSSSASQRDSMASAHFFSAAEGITTDEDDDATEDESERHARDIREGFASLAVHRHDVEPHQPHLLRDAAAADEDDEGAASDASGSTVGGPAMRLWRKARGKKGANGKKGKVNVAEEVDDDDVPTPRRRDASGQRSDASVRTSRAETALEGDEEDNGESSPPAPPPKRLSTLSVDPLTVADEENEEEEEADEAEDELGPMHGRAPTSATVKALRLHGHGPRALMRTSEVRSVEDRVWHDAFEAESLPIDAAYTHLAISGLGEVNSASTADIIAARPVGGDEGDLELLGPGEQRASAPSSNSDASRPKGAAASALQGGTVLLEFLAGSRIGASILAGPAAAMLAEERTNSKVDVSDVKPAQTASVERSGALSLIPVLPAHILWFFGMAEAEEVSSASTSASGSSSTAPPSSSPAASSAATTSTASVVRMKPADASLLKATGASGVSVLASLSKGVSSAWEGIAGVGSAAGGWLSIGGWLGASSTTPSTDSASKAFSDADRESDAEEWEWAIPAFDENSLASTPRPVYRRKRPVPSFQGGFAVREENGQDKQAIPADAAASEPLTPTSPARRDSTKPVHRQPKPTSIDPLNASLSGTRNGLATPGNSQRWSIIHFDESGVGRRAFVRGSAPRLV